MCGTSYTWRFARRATTAVTALGLATAAVACGSGSEDDRESVRAVTAAAKRVQLAFSRFDTDAICSDMTDAARRHAGTAGHGSPTTCARDVRRLLAPLHQSGGWRRRGEPRIGPIELDDRSATAVVTSRDGWRGSVAFALEDGRWRLDRLFGVPPARLDTGPSPLAGGERVEVLDSLAGGGRCPGVAMPDEDGYGADCRLEVESPKMRLSILTLFGDFHFADCWMSYDVAVGGDGRTWTHGFSVEGESGTACGDVEACEAGPGEPLPWRGRIYADPSGDGFRHHVDVCLETCVGYYEGEWTTRLVRRGGRWRAAAPGSRVGASGFAVDGAASLELNGIELRAAG